jgi:DNA polymerase I
MPQQGLFRVVSGRLRTDLRCTACDLCESPLLISNRMEMTGTQNPVYLIVGVSPGKEDDRIGKPMTGANGRLLRELLRAAQIDIWDCAITNALKCCLHDTTPKENHWKACRDYLIQEIKTLKPKAIICAGAKALFWLTGYSGVTKLQQRALPCILPECNVLVFPIKQPLSLVHAQREDYNRLRGEMTDDLRWIREQVESGKLSREMDVEVDYQQAHTKADLERFLAEIKAQPLLACDLETGDTSFQGRLFPEPDCRVVSIGFSWAKGVARAIPLHARGETSLNYWPDDVLQWLLGELGEILRTQRVFGQNFLAFDQKWIRHQWGIEQCNVDFDTMLGHYLLDEETGTHGLERLAAIYTSMAPWKAEFTLQDTEQMCRYLCKDVDATWRIREAIEPQLNDKQRWLMQNLLIPCSNVLMDCEYQGVHVSKENLDGLDSYLEQRINTAIAEIDASQEVFGWSLATNQSFNPESPAQVADLMENYLRLPAAKRTASGQYCVDKEVLKKHSHVPVIAKIAEVRSLRKLKSTYVKGMRDKIMADGKIHTSYLMHGTVTGRPSSTNPNLMNLPRGDTAGKVLTDGKAIKAIFAPSPGNILLQADYSQIELRVLACLAQDEVMLDIYRQGLDLHTATAAKAYGVPLERVTSAQRSGAKAINFGTVYGMSEETLIKRFMAAGSSETEAREFFAAHQRTFRGVWRYMAEQERLIRRYGYQETPLGRRRRFEEIDNRAIRQAYNFPIQSVASDFTELSIVRCDKVIRSLGLRARIMLTVYDSIAFDVPLGEFWRTAEVVKQVMEGISFPWLTVPIVADLEAGPNWGNLKKASLLEKKLL